MTRQGVSIAQTGMDISRTPDYKKTFDSRWPLLEIAHEDTHNIDINITDANIFKTTQVIYKHNLGYIPAFEWIDSRGYQGATTTWSDQLNFIDYDVIADKENVYLRIPFLLAPLSFQANGLLRVFSYDPTQEFKAASEPTGGDTTKSTFGFKILKDASMGAIEDTNFEEFSMNTDAKSIQVHQSGMVSSSVDTNYNANIKHDLGYMPSYMIFTKDGDYLVQGITARNYGDTNQLNFFGVQSVLIGSYAYIVFKDPMMETDK